MNKRKSGLSLQFIMRASLARHIKEIGEQAADTPYWQTADAQLAAGRSEIDNLTWYADYAERGYTCGARGVLSADWNYFTRDVDTLLERAGFSVEWSDEWTMCDECNRAVRTSPDSHGYQPYYVIQHSSIVCLDCLDWTEYLESIEDGGENNALVPDQCELAEHGYSLIASAPSHVMRPAALRAEQAEQGNKHLVMRQMDWYTSEVWQRDITLARVVDQLDSEFRRARDVYFAMDVSSPDHDRAEQWYDALDSALTLCEQAEKDSSTSAGRNEVTQ